MKKFFVLSLVISALPSAALAIDLKQAKFTQVVNDVKIISATDKSFRAASVNGVFKMPDLIRTGSASRAELIAEDETVTRVGANTIFSFDKANRTIDLRQGSLLFHSPHGKGGGTIRTATATASVLGTTLIVSVAPDGTVKVLDLEGTVEVRYKNGHREILESGEMALVNANGKQGTTATFNLGAQAKASTLVSGFKQPLSSLPLINAQVAIQTKVFGLQPTIGGVLPSTVGAAATTVSTVGGVVSSAGGTVSAVGGGTIGGASTLVSTVGGGASTLVSTAVNPVSQITTPVTTSLQPIVQQIVQPIVQPIIQPVVQQLPTLPQQILPGGLGGLLR